MSFSTRFVILNLGASWGTMQSIIKKLSGVRFFGVFSESILTFALPLIAFEASQNPSHSSLVLSAGFFARLIAYPFSGFLSDRLPEKILFTWATLIRMSLFFLAFGLNQTPLSFLILLSFLDGIFGGMTQIVFETLGPRIFVGDSPDPNEPSVFTSLPRFQTWIQSAEQLAFLIAPLCGGLFLTTFGFQSLLFFVGVTHGGAILLFRNAIHHPHQPLRNPVRIHKVRADFSRFYHLLSHQRGILFILILTALDNFLMGYYCVITTPLAIGVLHLSEQQLGLTLTLAHLMSFLAILACETFNSMKSTPWLWKWSYGIFYTGLLVLSWARQLPSFFVALSLIEMSCAIGIYSIRLLKAKLIPPEDFGKVSGFLYLLQQTTLPLGGMVLTVFSSHFTENNHSNLQDSLLFISIFVGIISLGFLHFTSELFEKPLH